MAILSPEMTACNAVADSVRAESSERPSYPARLRAARRLIQSHPVYTDAVELEAAIKALIEKCRTFARTHQDEYAACRVLKAHGFDPTEFDHSFGTLIDNADGIAWMLESLLRGSCPSLALPDPTQPVTVGEMFGDDAPKGGASC